MNSIIKVRLFVLTSKSQMTTPKTIQVKTFPTMYHKCPTDHFRKPKGGIHLPLVFFIELNTNKSDCVLQGPCKGLKSGFVLSWPTRRGKYEHRLGFSQQNSIDYVASEKEKTKQRVFRNFQLLLQQNAAFKFTTPFHDSQNKNCSDISFRPRGDLYSTLENIFNKNPDKVNGKEFFNQPDFDKVLLRPTLISLKNFVIMKCIKSHNSMYGLVWTSIKSSHLLCHATAGCTIMPINNHANGILT